MGEDLYRIEYDLHGFTKEDLTEEEWEKLEREFVRLYNKYCEYSNGKNGYERINKEVKRRYGDLNTKINGIDSYIYGTYVTLSLNEMLWAYPEKFASDRLEPFIFMDGWLPAFGTFVKNMISDTVERPWMSFSLVPA